MDTYSIFMHELKNPLNAIYGIAQILETENSIEEQKKYIKLLIKSINSIMKLDKDFDIYRKTGKPTLNRSTINVSNIINQLIEEYKPLAKENNIEIKSNIKASRAYTDNSKLEQALRNIISNAIKYSDSNKKHKSILIECRNIGSGVKICISDNGIGMNKEELSMIGTPFYRSKKIEQPGTGLGLCIVKKLSKLLNWEFSIESNPQIGTTVVIILYHIMG